MARGLQYGIYRTNFPCFKESKGSERRCPRQYQSGDEVGIGHALMCTDRNPRLYITHWIHSLKTDGHHYRMSAASSVAQPTSSGRIRILIADDHPSIRKAVKMTLEEQPEFEICAVVEDGRQAVVETRRLKPDVTILNVTMPHLNGLEAARLIKAERPETAIVILSSHADDEFLTIAKGIGVRGYVTKLKAGQELVKAVQAAVRGEDYYVLD